MLVSANFRRLVLGCIEADFCNQILIFQDFSRSTRLTFLCTAPDSKIAYFCLQNFANFVGNFEICYKIRLKSSKICYFSPRFSRNFAGISQNVSNFDVFDIAIFKIPENVEKIPKFCRKILQKFSRQFHGFTPPRNGVSHKDPTPLALLASPWYPRPAGEEALKMYRIVQHPLSSIRQNLRE